MGMHTDWTELIITVPAQDVERAGDIAQMVVPSAFISETIPFGAGGVEIAHIDLY